MHDEQYRRKAQISEYLAINESIQEFAQQLIGDLYRYRTNYNSNKYLKVIQTIQELKEIQMEQYYRDRLLANEKLSEASARSKTYLKVLMRLVIDYNWDIWKLQQKEEKVKTIFKINLLWSKTKN